MSLAGLALCSRFSYPPNSLSLCGPDKKRGLNYYAVSGKSDKGTLEILSQFSTLYPYLCLIANENRIIDPFDEQVVEAYWLGNHLLHKVPITKIISHLNDTLTLRKKIKKKELDALFEKISLGALPNHSFHVLNIYKRTGHLEILHTVETMDACLINWGRVIKIFPGSIVIETKPLKLINNKLIFGNFFKRTIMVQGEKDVLFVKLKFNDVVSYHWGYFCQKLTTEQLNNLIYYNNLSVFFANRT